MKTTLRKRSLAAAIIASVATMTGLSALAQEMPRRGGTLVYSLSGDPSHLNIAITNDLNAVQVATQIYSQLIRVDSEGNVSGDLAESWESAPDGLSYTFRIRKNVKWHDGRPLVAEDIRWALTEIQLKYNPNASTSFAAVDKIEAPDNYTLVIRLKQPFPAFMPWSLANQWIYPKHLYEGTDPRQNERNYKNPVGTGPFKLRELVRGSHAVMERNPDYYVEGRPYLDRLVVRVIPDGTARVLALENGELDYLSIYSTPASAVPGLRKRSDIVVRQHRTRINYGGIMAHINLRNEYLKSREVRQAISYAIDRAIFVERAANGVGAPASSPISQFHKPWYNPEVTNRYRHDPKKAEELLDAAGFKRGPNGRRFSIRIAYARAGEGGGLQATAELMREQLRAVGIDLVLEPKDQAVWTESAHIKWDFDLSMGSYQTGPDPAIAVARLYITRNIQKMQGRNLMGYSNPEVDRLFDEGEREIDQEKRIKIYHKIQEIMAEDVPALWLWDRISTFAHRTRVKGPIIGGAHLENFEGVWVTDGK